MREAFLYVFENCRGIAASPHAAEPDWLSQDNGARAHGRHLGFRVRGLGFRV